MKHFFKYIFAFTLPLLMLSCGDDNDEPELSVESTEYNAEYYVKYTAGLVNTSPPSNKRNKYSVNTESGIKTFTGGYSFSQTFGPFKKGFRATITVDQSDVCNYVDMYIYVSRGSEPFSLKAYKRATSSEQRSLSYTIDY